jgi:hypothetical protein
MPAADDRAFLSIIAWPKGWPSDRCAALVSDAAGLDAATMRLLARRAEPLILGEFSRATCAAAINAVRAHGGEAFAPAMDELEHLGPSRIKDLRIAESGIQLDLWRAGPVAIQAVQLIALIRTALSEVVEPRSQSGTEIAANILRRRNTYPYVLGWGFGGAYGIAAAFAADYADAALIEDDEAKPDPHATRRHLLDLHTDDGRVFQIDADKFGFRVLGDLRQHGDKSNTDRLCELLVHLAPHAVVDPFFSLWKPPPSHPRLRLPQMKINKDDPAFAFYSRWAALMYRHLLRPDGAA